MKFMLKTQYSVLGTWQLKKTRDRNMVPCCVCYSLVHEFTNSTNYLQSSLRPARVVPTCLRSPTSRYLLLLPTADIYLTFTLLAAANCWHLPCLLQPTAGIYFAPSCCRQLLTFTLLAAANCWHLPCLLQPTAGICTALADPASSLCLPISEDKCLAQVLVEAL